VVVEADPRRFLYPLLASEPLRSESGESVLVGAEGDRVVFLSPLRHAAVPPLTLRVSGKTPALPARVALETDGGFGAYRDYRGKAVLAATRRIRNAPWDWWPR
jgi:hypothetical protein